MSACTQERCAWKREREIEIEGAPSETSLTHTAYLSALATVYFAYTCVRTLVHLSYQHYCVYVASQH